MATSNSTSTLFPYTTLFRSYTISMELSGFKTYQETGIQLGAGQSVRQTYKLEVGQSSETISVEASFQLVNTVSPEQQQTFDMKDRKSTRLNSSHEWISYAVF